MGAILGQHGDLAKRQNSFSSNELGCSQCGMNDGLGADPVTIATTAATIVNTVGGLFGGSNRRESRAQRDASRNILYSMGVKQFGTHYNRHPEVTQLAQLAQQHGNIVVQAINEQIDKSNARGDGDLHRSDYEQITMRINQLLQHQQEAASQSSNDPTQAGFGNFMGNPFMVGSMVVGGGTILYLLTQNRRD